MIKNLKFKIKNLPRSVMREGVTLVELLVVIAIIGILSAVSVGALANIKSSRQVKVVAEEIKDNIIDARSYAVVPKNNPVNESVIAVRVTLTKKVGNSKATMLVQEMKDATNPSAQGYNKPTSFPDNITFDLTGIPNVIDANSSSFDFTASQQGYIGQILDSTGNAVADFSFIVQNTTGSERYQLAVNRFGYSTISKQPASTPPTPPPSTPEQLAQQAVQVEQAYNSEEGIVPEIIDSCSNEGAYNTITVNGVGASSGNIEPGVNICTGNTTVWPTLPAGYVARWQNVTDANGNITDRIIMVNLPDEAIWTCSLVLESRCWKQLP